MKYIEKYLKIPQRSSGLLYHYTSADGLRGILNGEELWISNGFFLNDTQELMVGNEIFTELVNENIEDDVRKRLIVQLFYEEMEKSGELHSFDGKHQSLNGYYILSCSKKDDSLIMWSEYSRYIGYCIKMDFRKLQKSLKYEAFFHGEVVYDRRKQKSILSDFIENEIFESGEALLPSSWNVLEKCDLKTLQEFINTIFAACIICNMFFKKACFQDEREYRLLFIGRGNESENNEKLPEVFFRTKESVIIPYIKNKVTSWDFVKKITIGPINQCDIAENGVKAILNYKDIKADVVKSEIPIRF